MVPLKEIKAPYFRQKTVLFFLPFLLFFLLGCNLSRYITSYLYDPERKDDTSLRFALEADAEATAAAKPIREWAEEEPLPNSAQEYAWQMGVKCIESPGADPCPLDACIVSADQYSVVLDLSNELFGKRNPDNYQCMADLQFTNNSGQDVLFWYIKDENEGGLLSMYSIGIAKDELYEEPGIVDYSRHEGVITYRQLKEIFVIYDNPHCQWIQYPDPKLEKFKVKITSPCGD